MFKTKTRPTAYWRFSVKLKVL